MKYCVECNCHTGVEKITFWSITLKRSLLLIFAYTVFVICTWL